MPLTPSTAPPLPDRKRSSSQPSRRPPSHQSRSTLPPPLPPSRTAPTPNAYKAFPKTTDIAAALPTDKSTQPEEDLTPIVWDTCFDAIIDIPVPDRGGVWRVYCAGFSLQAPNPPPTLLVFLHGAGHCALCWGSVASQLKSHVAVIAFDARGHGDTKHQRERTRSTGEDTDEQSSMDWDVQLDADTQVEDAKLLLTLFFQYTWPNSNPSSLVICGHSMGGAIAIRLAVAPSSLSVSGLIVVDVVEGTAMASLPHMTKWLAERTGSFSSVERAIRYVSRAGFVRNLESARLSVPPQLKFSTTRRCWLWRTQLEETEKYWRGWFQGLSPLFLSVAVPKLLVLANVNRLDKDLMIAQMQGKFQNILITSAGHAVHEDQPDQTANAILDYLHRNLLIDRGDDGETSAVFQQRRPVPPL